MRYLMSVLGPALMLCMSACASFNVNLADTPDSKLPAYLGILDRVDLKLKLLVPDSELKAAQVLYVAPITVALPPNDPPLLQSEVAMIDEKLYFLVIANQHEDERALREPKDIWLHQDLGRRIYQLDIKITHFDRGNGFKRYIIGDLFMKSSGAIIIDMEGVITDVTSGKRIATFTAREKGVGNAMNGLNPRVFSSHYCVRKASDDIAFQLSRKLRRFYSPEVNNGSAPRVK